MAVSFFVALELSGMLKKYGIDAPGRIQHVPAIGIGPAKVFCDDSDRYPFLNRLGEILQYTRTRCYAWALVCFLSTMTIGA